MHGINRRINSIEKKMSMGRHKKSNQPPLVLSVQKKNRVKAEWEDSLGPVNTWVTYQEQLSAAKQANAEFLKENPNSLPPSIVIELDADKEVQARSRLKANENNQILKNGGQDE
ncbi:MAG: hypothetical protein ACYS80_15070 [Planctomycetota bacterium]|jgi:hypothetical protein